jgi:hypothetical protein
MIAIQRDDTLWKARGLAKALPARRGAALLAFHSTFYVPGIRRAQSVDKSIGKTVAAGPP